MKVLNFVQRTIDSDFCDVTWWQGQCANLAIAIKRFLEGEGVQSHLEMNKDGEHVRVRVGRVILDTDMARRMFGSDRFREVENKEIVDNKILVTERRIRQVHNLLKKGWKNDA